jgi:hypothetical protein
MLVDTSLLYLLRDRKDLHESNCLNSSKGGRGRTSSDSKKKLFTIRLKEGEHIKQMTEVFGELALIAEPFSEEDIVVASLPDTYDVLVTARAP